MFFGKLQELFFSTQDTYQCLWRILVYFYSFIYIHVRPNFYFSFDFNFPLKCRIGFTLRFFWFSNLSVWCINCRHYSSFAHIKKNYFYLLQIFTNVPCDFFFDPTLFRSMLLIFKCLGNVSDKIPVYYLF